MNDLELGRVLKALSDPNRRRILELLAQSEKVCASDSSVEINCSMVTQQLTISQPTVSHHLKELAYANLITMTMQGNAALLSIRHDTFDLFLQTMRNRFQNSS